MSQSLFLTLLHIISISSSSSLSSLCDNAYGCVNQSLINTQNIRFYVGGYKAASGAFTSYTGGPLSCDGGLSCHSMSSINHSQGELVCGGGTSCFNTNIETNNQNIKCHGFNSCASSRITSTEFEGSDLYCDGHLSCAHATIQHIQTIHAKGAYSLYNATIFTNHSSANEFNLKLYGEFAAYKAQLICTSESTCKIYCYGYNACYGFRMVCIGTCKIYPESLDITEQNPTAFPLNRKTLFHTKTDETCNVNTSIVFDNKVISHSESIVVATTNGGPICCRGVNSCAAAKHIGYRSHMICSGVWACQNSDFHLNNHSIYCEAERSCFSANITDASTVLCFGTYGCESMTTRNTSQIICSADKSCKDAVFYSSGSDLNIYLIGYEAGIGANVYCNEGDVCHVICSGWHSCANTKVICGGSGINCVVECDGDYGCPMVKMPNSEKGISNTMIIVAVFGGVFVVIVLCILCRKKRSGAKDKTYAIQVEEEQAEDADDEECFEMQSITNVDDV
eukprot:262174_1